MDIGTFNGLYTLFLLCIFIALYIWAYSKRQKKTFEDIGDSIFNDAQLKEIKKNNNEKSGVKT